MAATDAAKKLNDHMNCPTVPWHGEYDALVGGTFNDTYEISKFINNWIKKWCDKQPPAQMNKI